MSMPFIQCKIFSIIAERYRSISIVRRSWTVISSKPTRRGDTQIVIGVRIEAERACARCRRGFWSHEVLLTVSESRIVIGREGECGRILILHGECIALKCGERGSSLWLHPAHTTPELGHHIDRILD